MNNRMALASLALVVSLAGCGGGGGGGGGGGTPSNGEVVSTSGTVSTSNNADIPFGATSGHAYSVELTPTSGNPNMLVADHVYTASEPYWGSPYEMSTNSGSNIDVISFITPADTTYHAYLYTLEPSATYTLQVLDNQLTVDGPGRSRKALDSSVYFSFSAVAGQAYQITVTPTNGDPVLKLYSSISGYYPTSLISTSNTSGVLAENIIFIPTETKTYYFEVGNANTSVELDFSAVVQTTTPDADLRVSINSLTYNSGNLTVNYTVSNKGVATSSAANLHFWLNYATAPTAGMTGDDQIQIGNVAAGGMISGSRTINVGALTSGSFWAYVDSENAVVEVNENNNASAVHQWSAPLAAPQSFDLENGMIPATFIASGNAGWIVDASTASSGSHSIRAQTITHNQTACVATTINNSSSIAFDWKVNSESSYDYLEFYIDGVIQTGKISGTVDWTAKQYLGLTMGTHEFKWCYKKDGSMSAGSDTAWVDNIRVN